MVPTGVIGAALSCLSRAKRASVAMMPEAADEIPDLAEQDAPPPRRRRRRWLLALAAIVFVALGAVWLARERLAERIIAGQLEELDLPAKYDIERISVNRQVLRDVVIGDPARPDFTAQEVVVETELTLGLPTFGRVTLVRPRLYGTYRQGKLSFGALDKVIFAETDRAPGLPDLYLKVLDGRGRIDSDLGNAGLKLDGAGNLRSGFTGTFAATIPQLAVGPCQAEQATLYGQLTSKDARLGFVGPLRGKSLSCTGDLRLADGAVQLDLWSSEAFDALTGRYALTSGALTYHDNRFAGTAGKGELSLAKGDLTASYDLEGKGFASPWAAAASLAVDGALRSREKFARIEAEGEIKGSALRPGRAVDAALAEMAQTGQGTLLGPLARQLRQGLAREGSASRLSALYNLRQSGAITKLTLPRLALRGTSGADVLLLTRGEALLGTRGGPRLAGNLRTGGAGLPVIEGRIERSASQANARLAMREYRAGESRAALPELRLVQERGGAIGLAGRAVLSGALPGGRVDNLALPLDGTWSQRRGLAMGRRCMAVRFDRLAIAKLSLDARSLQLCPGKTGAMLASDARGTRLAVGTAGLNLSGKLSSTPVRLTSGAIGLAWPGTLSARDIKLELGGETDPTRLSLGQVDAQLGQVIAGRFGGSELRLNNVPLDVYAAEGNWRFADGRLTVGEGAFWLKDRMLDARFYPLVARDARLSLSGSEFVADAILREPKSDREIVMARIVHDMDDQRGHADLAVPGIVFDRKLQPTTLTYLAQGVIALAKGTVTGTGRIDWVNETVTSSGSFSTPKLDFAAAFGPVEGTSGTVNFTDLLGLVTAPDQRLKLAAINPGVEVNDGEVSFQLEPDRVLVVNGAQWPFIDGTLELLPTRMVLGASEVRRYTLKVEGANAAKFIAKLELGNLAATGIFDGTLPIVFDEQGGRIEGGKLVSRAPGGNVSYVGELSYKDMGAMANFAFQSLRSIDFGQMEIGMDGSLEGEIVTRVRFDGVRQGASAKRSIITRSLAGLPIRFNINIRAPFHRLLSSFKALYDPAFVRDPRELGLIDSKGEVPPAPQPSASPPPSEKPQAIQPPDSRNRP